MNMKLLLPAVATFASAIVASSAARAQEIPSEPPLSDPGLQREIAIGFRVSPVNLDLHNKNVPLVGLGSYLVNVVGGCNDCHTNPSYAPGHNPFLGQPKRINVAGFLAGGQAFGPFISRNLTPENGLPAGRTFAQFELELRTGADLDHPGQLLQVMPWPDYQSLSQRDILAIYTYLSAIPPRAPQG